MTPITSTKTQGLKIDYMPYITGWFGNFVLNNALLVMLIYRYDPGVPNDNNLPIIVPSALVGMAMMVSRIGGAFVQPFVGYLSDRFWSPLGKRRPFLLISLLPLIGGFFFLFNPPTNLNQIASVIYLGIMLWIFYVGMAIYHVPYLAWLPTLAKTPERRVKLSTQIGVFGLVGATIGGIIAPWLTDRYGFTGMGIAISLLGLITLAMPVLEKEEYVPSKGKYPSFKTALSSAFANSSFRTYIFAMIMAWMVISVISVIPTFLVIALLKREVSFAAIINTAMIGSAIAGFAFVIPLSKKYGKKLVFQGSLIWFGIGMIIMALGRFWFQDLLIPWLIIVIIAHFALASFFSLPNAMLSDIIEEDAEQQGTRREAIFFGTRGLIIQFSQGFASLLTGLILSLGKTPTNPWGVQIAFLFAGLLSLGAARMLSFSKSSDILKTMNTQTSLANTSTDTISNTSTDIISDTSTDIPKDIPLDAITHSQARPKNAKLPWRIAVLGLLGILSSLIHPPTRNLIFGKIGASTSETATNSETTAKIVPVEVKDTISKALPVRTLTVSPVSSHQESRRYSGNIVVKRSSDIGFEQSGKLVSLLVEEGQPISKGALVASLDTQNLQVQRRELLAQRSQATAQLRELEAGPRSQTIAASKAKVRDLQEQLVLAQAKFKRRENLLKAGAISSEQLEEVRTDVKAQQARVDEAQSQVDELLAGTRPEQIALQKSVIDQFNAQIDRIDLDIQKSQLKAPYSGTIAQRNVNIGTVITAGQPIVRLVEDNNLEARIGIPAQKANQLGIGSSHRLKIGEQIIAGRVTSILPVVDSATRTVTVIFKLNQSRGIRSGQVVSVELSDSIPLSGYWLPTGALVKGTRGLWSCYVLGTADPENSRVFNIQRKDVEVISIQGDRLLVRGTLTPGDRVIVEGAHRIVTGQMVEAI